MTTPVTLEQLRSIHRAEPFQPFLLRLVDGREFAVSHPEILAISAGDSAIAVMRPDGKLETFDLALVASVHTKHGDRGR
jgi:hypothetical protein